MKKQFDVVVYWDEVAWVASTVGDRWYASQGKTAQAALDSLKNTMAAEAFFDVADGKKPFANKLKSPAHVNELFALARPLGQACSARKRSSYKHTFEVEVGSLGSTSIPTVGFSSVGGKK